MQALARVLTSRLRAASAAGPARWVSAGPGASGAAQAAAAAEGTAAAAAASCGESSAAARAALLFGRSALLYAACDTLAAAAHHPHVLLAGGATAAAAAAARWGLARAAARQSAGAAGTTLLPAAVRNVLERTGARALASGQAQLPARIVVPTLVAAHASSRMLTFNVLGLHSVANHLALQGWLQEEEVPVGGRRRPALPVLTYDEEKARQDPAPCGAMLLKMGIPGATLYPADHPKTRQAQAILDRLQAAATALITEQHGSDSPVLRRHVEHFAGHTIKVRVYDSEGPHKHAPGNTGLSGAIVLGNVNDPGEAAAVLAMQLGRLICRHDAEGQSNSHAYLATGSTLLTASTALRVALVDAGRVRPLVFGGLLYSGLTLIQLLAAPPAWLRAALGSVCEHAAPASGGGDGVKPAPPPRAAAPSGPAKLAPLLRPGQLGFNDEISHSRAIVTDLEEDQVAMLILARAGYHPVLVSAVRCRLFKGLHAQLQVAMVHRILHDIEQLGTPDHVEQRWPLTHIHPDEVSSCGLSASPNPRKLLHVYKATLPRALDIYRQRADEHGVRRLRRWLPRLSPAAARPQAPLAAA